MSQLSPNSRRAWQALDIGPQWVRRDRVRPDPAGHGASRPTEPSPQRMATIDSAVIEEPVQALSPDALAPEKALPTQVDMPVVAARPSEPEQSAAPDVVQELAIMAPSQNPAEAKPIADWPALEQAVASCQKCSLCETRHTTVFGQGDRSARWVIVGEAPGAEEDRKGQPFVGPAGVLLDNMLQAVGASRERGAFILNVLKCRPPDNRNPSAEEVAQCADYLQQQLQLLRPALIFAMGRFAVNSLLGQDKPVGEQRGRIHQVQIGGQQIALIAGFHPAYYLRNPNEKYKAWQDLCLARTVAAPVLAKP